ncbi:multicopper oxidase family protein [Anaeromyxobacter diazotrophicus]|uniref:Multicopper oxidase CueO n=1 Tax=Anaeromyxobacter diazotrophicus TaxID=2590199 RepID=A0A7I9VS73_9BACT|nr:multicopper oxidase domain-containing protein [Anaeromyxobacter diazotrophicus]GEJ58960.1 spore coat protein [Anaeromyxobacter diazotrophicus]
MPSRTRLTALLAAGFAALTLACGSSGTATQASAASSANPAVAKRPLDPEAIGQFLVPLPAIPVRTPDTATFPGKDYYVVTAIQGEHDFGLRRFDGTPFVDPASGKPVRTVSWGYDLSYLGSTVVARRDRPVVIDYVNGLVGSDGKPLAKHLFTVDPTVDGAGFDVPQVRTVPHLHGGHSAAEADGHPSFWFTADPKAAANGMGGPAGNRVRYTYENDQPAATNWFHDHAMGVTRLNVYAGLAAAYLVRDAAEDALGLPGGAYEVPLLVQDKSFNDDGSLDYATYPLYNPYTQLPLVDPSGAPMYSSGPETFANTVIVNGVVWPYLEVEPRRYRFRVWNGADSRFFNLWLEEAGVGPLPGLFMQQVGAEAGFLPETVDIGGGPGPGGLLLAPGERADVVVDFSGFAGKSITLRNDAPAPFPNGDDHNFNANTVGKVMQFRVVKPLAGADTSAVPAAPLPVAPLPAPDHQRVVDLQELQDVYDILDPTQSPSVIPRHELRLNGLRFADPVTEQPKLGTVEDWWIVNTTVDMHPMHLHLVTFEVVEKGSYDAASYLPAAGGVMGTMLPGGFHPDTDPAGHADGQPGFDPAYAVAPNERGRKDTVRVPPGGYVRIRARFDRPGEYMWHCHILAHEEHAMMRPFRVVP